mgnify:CR=1 FL=1
MVCDRCIRTVKRIFDAYKLQIGQVQLGEVDLLDETLGKYEGEIRKDLEKEGFELMDDINSQVIEQIKNVIVETIHGNKSQDNKINFSRLIENKLLKDYSHLSNLFSMIEGITIEKYTILQKTERVKELLVYNELSLSEIAFQMGYSSVAHLSSQFKKTTGLTPTHFKSIKETKRMNLDKV